MGSVTPREKLALDSIGDEGRSLTPVFQDAPPLSRG